MVIVALLIGGLVLPLSAQQDIRQNAETKRQLDEIREALIGYAAAKGYFPCPAKSTFDGTELVRTPTGGCPKRLGLLPWTTLGVKPSDSWNHLFLYSVTPAFSNSASLFTLNSPSDITIQTRDATGNLVNLSNVDSIPLVVLSTGKNGYLSWTLEQAIQNPDSASTNTDEDTNALATANGKNFVSRTPTGLDAGTGEFDDLVVWISPYILFNRMIAAGKLP